MQALPGIPTDWNASQTTNMESIRININKQLLTVEDIGTIFAFVVYQALCVVHVGVHHLDF